MIDKDNIGMCKCKCHIKGTRIIHCISCCNLTYQKYLNEDGTLDIEAYEKCVKKMLDRKR